MTLIVVGLVLLVAWPAYNLTLVALAALSQAANRRRRRYDAQSPTGNEPEEYWIVIPCLNEERVVARTVASALALQGPVGSATYVLVVDDASDDGTPQVLAAIDHPNLVVLRRVLPDARRGKGEALNAAYRFIRDCSELYCTDPRRIAVGVIDGDGRGSHNLLMEVANAMREREVGATQCRVRIHNRDRVLGAVQDLEFACIANASQVLRNGLGTVGLGGNGQFTRLSVLKRLGEAPWSKCLVEDLEVGLRMHLGGEQIRYLPGASVNQQGVVDPRRLLRQRTRWAQGNLQCVSYVPKLIASRRIRNSALLEMLYYLLSPWFNAFGTFAALGVWGYAMWRLLPGHGTPFLVSSWHEMATIGAVWTAALIVPHLVWAVIHKIQLRDESLRTMLVAGAAYPSFLALGLVSTWRAVGRQITGRNAWAKTERLADGPSLAPVLVKPLQARRG